MVMDFMWDAEKLRKLDLPRAQLHTSSLEWHLSLPFWLHDGCPFQVTPEQVAAEPRRYNQQYARTMAADLGYPLDVVEHPDGRITILDGVHRLLKARLTHQHHVDVRVLPWCQLDDITV